MAEKYSVRWLKRTLFRRKASPYYWGHVRDQRTGKVHRFSTGKTAKKRANEYVNAWIQEQEDRETLTTRAKVPTFDRAYREFLGTKDIRDSTRRDYEYDFNGVYSATFGSKLTTDVTFADVQRFLARLAKTGQSARNRQKHLIMLRSFFRWCVRMKYAAENPCDGIKVGPGDKRGGKALDIDEARQLLLACREEVVVELKPRKTPGNRRKNPWKQTVKPPPHLHAAVAIGLYTGLRRSNVTGLQWKHVDLAKGRIVIPAAAMKSKRDHTAPIHPALRRIFDRLLAGRSKMAPEDPVIGGALTSIRKSFKSALKRAGLPDDLRWHDLRHTFATWMAARCTVFCLRDLLGHSPGLVTFDYTHTPWQERVEAIEKLPNLLTNSEVDSAASVSR